MRLTFSIKWIYLIERRNFDQKYKFSNKNDMVSAWRNFKNIFSRPLFTIIFRPQMIKFHPYSNLTGEGKVDFLIYCMLIKRKCEECFKIKSTQNNQMRLHYDFWPIVEFVLLFEKPSENRYLKEKPATQAGYSGATAHRACRL